MTEARSPRGPVERATRSELTRAKVRAASRGLAAATLVVAQRIDDLPAPPEHVECPDCGMRVEVPDSERTRPSDLAALTRELRASLQTLTEGTSVDDPAAGLGDRWSTPTRLAAVGDTASA